MGVGPPDSAGQCSYSLQMWSRYCRVVIYRGALQESFLDIELADELRHDYLDSMDAESRNKILCANEKVIKSCLS